MFSFRSSWTFKHVISFALFYFLLPVPLHGLIVLIQTMYVVAGFTGTLSFFLPFTLLFFLGFPDSQRYMFSLSLLTHVSKRQTLVHPSSSFLSLPVLSEAYLYTHPPSCTVSSVDQIGIDCY